MTKNFDEYFNKKFNRIKFYEKYYKNLTPSNFKIKKDGNKIIIEINEINR